MNCPEVKNNLSCYVDAEMDAESTTSIERHLQECASCREALQAMRNLVSACALSVDEEVPAGLGARLSQTVAAAQRCIETASELALAASAGLSPAAKQHVEECRVCSEDAQFYSRYAAASAMSEVAVPDGLRQAIASATYARRSRTHRLWAGGAAPWKAALGAGVVAAVVLISVFHGTINSTGRPVTAPPSTSLSKAPVAPQTSLPSTTQKHEEGVSSQPQDSDSRAPLTVAAASGPQVAEKAAMRATSRSGRSKTTRRFTGPLVSKSSRLPVGQVAALPVPETPTRSDSLNRTVGTIDGSDSYGAEKSTLTASESTSGTSKPLVVVRVEPEDLVERNAQINLTADIQRRIRERKHRGLTDISPDESVRRQVSIKLWEAKF